VISWAFAGMPCRNKLKDKVKMLKINKFINRKDPDIDRKAIALPNP
jgi:hypothetical protein